jgi:acetyl-CoA C-acetyltransferase
MPEAVIVAASRVVRDVMTKVPELDPREVNDVMLGCAQPAGEAGHNLARVVSVLAGLDTPGTTVNRYCSSSLQTSRMRFHAIKAGEGHVFVSAGVETASRYGHGKSDGMPGTRNPAFHDDATRSAAGRRPWTDPRDHGDLPDVYLAMGQTAESVAELESVTREEQDRVNTRGGAIALGHSFGMTGARITTTLMSALATDDQEVGMLSMCVGGGQGMAMIIERCA